jgi:hypothetical protein
VITLRRRSTIRGHFIRAALIALAIHGISTTVFAQTESDSDRLKRLIDRIARGDAVESAAASERLVDLVAGPVAEAIGSMESRPVEEQMRLRQALARLTGALRLRVFRLDLTGDDRGLFDAFTRAYPELAERLFDGDWRIRKAAVRQIPLEPNTGVGLFVAAKINDEDAEVAEAALEMAAALHDSVVARALTRYVQDATRAMQAGLYGPQQWELALTVAVIVQRSITIIAAADYREGVPAIIAALEYHSGTKYWDQTSRAAALRALGRLKDRQAAAALLKFLDDGSFLRWRQAGQDKRASETVGDVALAALLEIFQRTPDEFGLFVTPEDPTFAGYSGEDDRREGHRAFRIWYDQNVGKPGAGGPTTQAAAPDSKP